MKREIKFRAWYNKLNIMAYSDKDVPADVDYWDGVRSSRIGMLNNGFKNPMDDMEVMQFTGLKDREGNEIYESDFLITDKGIRFLVFWNWEKARFATGTENVWNKEGNSTFYKSIEWAAKKCVVAGNIYEVIIK